MLKQGQVQEFVDCLEKRGLLFLGLPTNEVCAGVTVILFHHLSSFLQHLLSSLLLQLIRLGANGPHQGSGNTAVQQETAEDEEAAAPAKYTKEDLVHGCQSGEEDRAARHSQPVSQGTPLEEVLADYG